MIHLLVTPESLGILSPDATNKSLNPCLEPLRTQNLKKAREAVLGYVDNHRYINMIMCFDLKYNITNALAKALPEIRVGIGPRPEMLQYRLEFPSSYVLEKATDKGHVSIFAKMNFL